MRIWKRDARKRWLLLLLLPLAIGTGYAFGPARLSGALVSVALADPSSIFAARSPGARRPGALTQTKPARVASNAARKPFAPAERVLSNVRTRPTGFPDTYLPTAEQAFLGDPLALPDEPVIVPGIGDIALPTGGGGIALPFIPPGGVGQLPPDDDEPPIPGVPEPATWLMMIGGFLAIGASLRSRKLTPTGGASTAAIPHAIARL